jgi:hypothetical protein
LFQLLAPCQIYNVQVRCDQFAFSGATGIQEDNSSEKDHPKSMLLDHITRCWIQTNNKSRISKHSSVQCSVKTKPRAPY